MTTHLPADNVERAGVENTFQEMERRLLFAIAREDTLQNLQSEVTMCPAQCDDDISS